ncbi:MAG: type II toxin-antitoxin system HicB family antitoxin [Nitrospirae bacterium]|nr:type II toxin-antitoxin system HicB family antitoxin [Nitrospirota bacterium]
MHREIYPVVIQEGEDGKYVVTCPAIEGCYSQGDSIPDALANIKEAIALCLEVMAERGEAWPVPTTTLLSEVAVEV